MKIQLSHLLSAMKKRDQNFKRNGVVRKVDKTLCDFIAGQISRERNMNTREKRALSQLIWDIIVMRGDDPSIRDMDLPDKM